MNSAAFTVRVGVSNQQINLTSEIEGLKLIAYQDETGVWTLGSGTTNLNGKKVVEGMTCTAEQAMSWVSYDLNSAANQIVRAIGYIPAQNQLDAAADMVYNLGIRAWPLFLSNLKERACTTNLEILNGIDVKIKSVKKPCFGLIKRRITNYNTFTLGAYTKFDDGDKISPELHRSLLNMNTGKAAQDLINSIPIG